MLIILLYLIAFEENLEEYLKVFKSPDRVSTSKYLQNKQIVILRKIACFGSVLILQKWQYFKDLSVVLELYFFELIIELKYSPKTT